MAGAVAGLVPVANDPKAASCGLRVKDARHGERFAWRFLHSRPGRFDNKHRRLRKRRARDSFRACRDVGRWHGGNSIGGHHEAIRQTSSACHGLRHAGTAPHGRARRRPPRIPPILITPDKVETRIGTLEFKDGAPSAETAAKVYDTLDFTRGLDAFLNSYGGASAYAIRQGLLSIGAEDNSVTIYPELMDSKSLFLTANADTVYYFSIVDLTKGPMVVEQPPKGLGTINDMWFGWIIDIGFPGPDRGEGGRYLLLPPGYDGPVPDGGFYVARSKTTRVMYAARAFLTDNDPKPTVENIKKTIKIYPYTPGGFGTSIATALEGKVRLEVNPPVPATKFVEASGKSFNTIPPSDYSFFEMINANVQQEPADSYNPELAGQLAAIGIVKGKPFNPDARMRKILTDAAAVGNAAGRALNWRPQRISRLDLLPRLILGQHAVAGWRQFRDAAADVHQGGLLQTVAADRRADPRLENGVLLRLHPRLPGHDHAAFPASARNISWVFWTRTRTTSTAARPTR